MRDLMIHREKDILLTDPKGVCNSPQCVWIKSLVTQTSWSVEIGVFRQRITSGAYMPIIFHKNELCLEPSII